jgi:hypothetical protein
MLLDLTNAKEQSFETIPAGEYTLFSYEVMIKETRSGTGEYIQVKFKITTGEQEGRFIYHTFNIKNDNQKAVEIGLGQLKTFMKLAGMKDLNKLTDVNELGGHTINAVVKIKKDDEYGDKAVISYFKPYVSKTVASTSAPF